MKCLDCFLAQLRAGQIENEHTVESTNEELAEYNRRALAGVGKRLFLTPPPRWCQLANKALKARQQEDWSEERRQAEIDFLWNYCFAEAAHAWNRDYRRILQEQLPMLEIAAITRESFSIWLDLWPFQ